MESIDGAELVRRGLECGRHKQLERGVLFLVEGIEQVDEHRHPRLVLSAYHNLALFLAHLGLPVVARGVLLRARRLYREVGDPIMNARLVWLQGTLARIAGNNKLAVKRFRRAIRMFEEINQPDQAAQIQDDLREALNIQAILATPIS